MGFCLLAIEAETLSQPKRKIGRSPVQEESFGFCLLALKALTLCSLQMQK